MFWNKRRPKMHFEAQKALAFTAVAGAIEPPAPEPFSVAKHVQTISGMLEAIDMQLSINATKETDELALNEANERAENNRHALIMEQCRFKRTELETLRDTYTAALKIAAPGGSDGYGSISATYVAPAKDYEQVPPYEECAANGAGGHSFNSFNPDGVTVICDYCGKEAPEQFQRPKPVIVKSRRTRKPVNNPSPTPPAN